MTHSFEMQRADLSTLSLCAHSTIGFLSQLFVFVNLGWVLTHNTHSKSSFKRMVIGKDKKERKKDAKKLPILDSQNESGYILSHLGQDKSTERGRAKGNTFWRVFRRWFNQFTTLYTVNEKMKLLEITAGGPGPTSPNSCHSLHFAL